MERILAQLSATFATGALFTSIGLGIVGHRADALVLVALATAVGIIAIGLLED